MLAQLFTAEELLFQAALAAALVLVVLAVSRPHLVGPGLRRGLRAAGWALLVFLPVAAYPLWVQFFGPLRQRGNPFLPDYFAADLAGFVVPSAQMLLRTARSSEISARFPGGQEEHLAYLGLPLLAVCVLAAVLGRHDLRVRCAAVAGAVLALLSLGGRLWVAGEWTQVPGPWALLRGLPVIEGALPSRFSVSVAAAAALLLGLAVDAARTRAGGVAAAGLGRARAHSAAAAAAGERTGAGGAQVLHRRRPRAAPRRDGAAAAVPDPDQAGADALAGRRPAGVR